MTAQERNRIDALGDDLSELRVEVAVIKTKVDQLRTIWLVLSPVVTAVTAVVATKILNHPY